MTRDILKYAGVGLAIVIVAVAIILYWNRGSHVALEGSIQKVRIQGMDERSCVVIVDFRFKNPADYPFIVRDARLYLEDPDGKLLAGDAVSANTVARLFKYYPLLGPQYNDSLMVRDRIQPHETMDRMLCARFTVPDSTAELRRRLIIRIEDVDGAVSEIVEDRSRTGT